MNTKVVISILSAVLAALVGLVFVDLYRMRQKNVETLLLLMEESKVMNNQTAIQSARSIRKEAGGEIDSFENFVLTDDKLISTIETLERAGDALGVEVEIASVDKSQTDIEPSQVRFVIEVKGSWPRVVSYIKALENLPRKKNIENVYLVKEANIWRGNVALTLYSFK